MSKIASKTLCFILGTRPEVIKVAPIIQALRRADEAVPVQIILTGQHPAAAQYLTEFDLQSDIELRSFCVGQSLSELTSKLLVQTAAYLRNLRQDGFEPIVVVHGDTQSSLAGALAGYTERCRVVHVEAGLRTHDVDSPFPEEGNRQMIARLADLHFAPHAEAHTKLLSEGIAAEKIRIVGNSIEDSVRSMVLVPRKRILLTLHRRESGLGGIEKLLRALQQWVAVRDDVELVYPVHANPKLSQLASDIFGDQARTELLAPLPYRAFLKQIQRADLILSDSGGVQEEARILNRPLWVLRSNTERTIEASDRLIRRVDPDPASLIAELERHWPQASLDSPSQKIARALCRVVRDERVSEAIPC